MQGIVKPCTVDHETHMASERKLQTFDLDTIKIILTTVQTTVY